MGTPTQETWRSCNSKESSSRRLLIASSVTNELVSDDTSVEAVLEKETRNVSELQLEQIAASLGN